MKQLNIYTYMITVLLGLSFSVNAQVSSKSRSNLIEITQLIETDVWLYDTTKQSSMSCPRHLPMEAFPNKFLSYKGFNLFTDQLQHTFNDPNALIYIDPETKSPAGICLLYTSDAADD